MVLVALCDDERQTCADLERVLIAAFERENVRYEIDVYFSAETLCARMKAGAHYDLVFLDIKFLHSTMSGVDAGHVIRETLNNRSTSIVYISWHTAYSMSLFGTQPLDFLIKPLKPDDIERAITTFLQLAGLRHDTISYTAQHQVHKVHVHDIVYLESRDRKILLHLADGNTAEFYGALNKLYREQLSGLDFLYIHSAYVVNYDFIASLRYDGLVLFNGTGLPISRPKRKDIRHAYGAIAQRRAT